MNTRIIRASGSSVPGPSPLFYKRDYSSLLSTTFPLSWLVICIKILSRSPCSLMNPLTGIPASMRLYKSSASACRFPWKLTMMSSSRMAMVWTLGSFFKIPMAVRLSPQIRISSGLESLTFWRISRHVAGKDDLSGVDDPDVCTHLGQLRKDVGADQNGLPLGAQLL